jgi:trk system potassium uptake protein TrkA
MGWMKQFAVIGLGRFGSSLARTLTRMGYEVLAVDSDEKKVEDMTDAVTHCVKADALDDTVLKSLGIRNFDIVIVAIGHDIQSSILLTVKLKEMGVKKVVAKANTDLHGKVLEKVGADIVVFPERDMGERVAKWLVSNNIIDQINLSPEYSLVELSATRLFIGKSLQELALRKKYGITVLAIRRQDDLIVSPQAGLVVQEGDILILVGRNSKLKLLETD